jgi:hypothetical protein
MEIGLIMMAFVVLVPLLSTVFGAESRPEWLRLDRKPRVRTVGSMRPEDWPPSEFER